MESFEESETFLKLIFIGVSLIYNVVFVSAVRGSESVIHMNISTFLDSFPIKIIKEY